MTVAPLTATVLADADEPNAGIASGVNNALARMAGLLAVAALGIIVSGAITLGVVPPRDGDRRGAGRRSAALLGLRRDRQPASARSSARTAPAARWRAPPSGSGRGA